MLALRNLSKGNPLKDHSVRIAALDRDPWPFGSREKIQIPLMNDAAVGHVDRDRLCLELV